MGMVVVFLLQIWVFAPFMIEGVRPVAARVGEGNARA
jgi:hypothetical protein